MRNKKWQWELKRQWELITILLKLKKLNRFSSSLKKRMLLEDYECGPNGRDYDLDNIFTFEDEEKKEW